MKINTIEDAEKFLPAFTRYTYGAAPDSLPVDWTGELDVPTRWDEIVSSAGFDPDDEEVGIGYLTENWNGHDAGALVVSGATVTGHPFAVESPAD